VVLPGQITDAVADYGPVGVTLVLSIWLVVLSGVIFGGALLGAVIVDRRQATVRAYLTSADAGDTYSTGAY